MKKESLERITKGFEKLREKSKNDPELRKKLDKLDELAKLQAELLDNYD